MDNYIEKIALSTHKKVASLDTSQVVILRSSSNPDHPKVAATHAKNCIDLMHLMLNDSAAECDIIQDYKTFNLNYQLKKEIQPQNDALQLLQRNKRWVLILDKAFRENSCFVAVGYGHLMYQQGLIEKLRAIGYQVKPIPTRT